MVTAKSRQIVWNRLDSSRPDRAAAQAQAFTEAVGAEGMIISDMAFRDMEETARSATSGVSRMFAALFRRGPAIAQPRADTPHIHLVAAPPRPDSQPGVATERPTEDPHWRKHPLLRVARPESGLANANEDDRLARAACTRAIFHCRASRFKEARTSFAIAAEYDGTDISAIEGFWELSRLGMQAAIDAYEDADRVRDAARLEATIRLRFRPKLIALPLPRPRSAAGS